MISYEVLTEERVGYGTYQTRALAILALIFTAEGIEMSALSLIFPLLKTEWDIDEAMQSLIGSALFVGFLIGSLVAGFLTDKLGRKKALEYISLSQFFLGIYSSTLNNVYIFLMLRFFIGFFVGFVVPLTPTLCAEISPMEKRGKITVIINAMFSVGQFIASVIAWICLNSLSSGNWRMMLLICSFPPLLVWYTSRRFLKESPRFIMLDTNIENGLKILNEIGKINSPNFVLFNEKDIKYFTEWRNSVLISQENEDKFGLQKFFYLFSKKNHQRRITLSLWVSWFGINFVFYGLIMILPFFMNECDKLNDNKIGLVGLVVTTVGEGLSGIVAYFLVDTHIFGRKYSLALGQIISSLFSFFAYLIDIKYSYILIAVLTISRLFGKMCFSIIYPLTAELYTTQIRTMGIGLASAVGRIAGCIMPMLALRLFYTNIHSPFALYFFVGMSGLVGTLMLPYDTRGRFLDNHDLNNDLLLQK